MAGYWTRQDNTGLSMLIFESADAARQLADRMRSIAPDTVTFEGAEVREVVANA